MDWKKKLTSRKLWAAIASFASMLIIAMGGAEGQAAQITALIMAGATVIAYIIGEGLVDASSASAAPAQEEKTNDVASFEDVNANG